MPSDLQTPEEMRKLLEAADELSKGGIVASRPTRVALGKAFKKIARENRAMKSAIEIVTSGATKHSSGDMLVDNVEFGKATIYSPIVTMTNSNTLREAIIKLLYEEAPNTPWLTDIFYDKLLSLIEREFQKREKDTFSKAADIMWDECVKNGAKEWGEWDCEVDGKKFLIRIQLDSVPKFEQMIREKEELLAMVKSTAKGALVASERDKNAMKKAMEAIGLLNSMLAGGEEHSETSKKLVEGAVVDLLHAMQFKADAPRNGAGLGVWAGTPEMADEFLRQNPSHSSL